VEVITAGRDGSRTHPSSSATPPRMRVAISGASDSPAEDSERRRSATTRSTPSRALASFWARRVAREKASSTTILRSTTKKIRRGAVRSSIGRSAWQARAKTATSMHAVFPLAVGRSMHAGQSPTATRSASIRCQGNGG